MMLVFASLSQGADLSDSTILAYNVDGKELFVCPPYGVDFSVVEITCNPPAKFREWPDGSWRGKTPAMEGHFFGVICADGQCTPLDVDFVAGSVEGETPQTHEGVSTLQLCVFYGLIGGLSLGWIIVVVALIFFAAEYWRPKW